VSFFDDDAEVTQVTTPGPRPRRHRNRARLRIQRLVIALVALFVLVFVLALVIRSCQQNAKESSYRTYFSEVRGVETDAAGKVGKPIAALLADPTRYGRTGLEQKLDSLVQTQTEITQRTERISPPGKLKDLHQILVQGQLVRLSGVEQVRAGLLAALSGKDKTATASKLAALSGYFTGPDVYYNELFYRQAQKVMAGDGVSNVAVPTVSFFSHSSVFTASALRGALATISSSTKLTGLHGVGLGGVTIRSNGKNTTLTAGASNRFVASIGMQVLVTVENQGSSAESNVTVKATITGPGISAPQTFTTSIPNIPVHGKRTATVTGWQIPASSMTKSLSLAVMAGPVPGEKHLSNNHATFTIVPVLK
jgi:hypothetical protein